MFMAYLFVVALNWKQPKYTLTDESIDKLCLYNGMIPAKKKEWTINTSTSMVESEDNYDELRKKKRTQYIISLA